MNRVDYVLTRKANGDARTVKQIGAEFDAFTAALAPPAPDQAELTAARDRAEKVNAWLLHQQPGEAATDAEREAWEELRRLPFEDQAKRAGL